MSMSTIPQPHNLGYIVTLHHLLMVKIFGMLKLRPPPIRKMPDRPRKARRKVVVQKGDRKKVSISGLAKNSSKCRQFGIAARLAQICSKKVYALNCFFFSEYED